MEGLHKVDGDMFGTWKPSTAKTHGPITPEAMPPCWLRESFRARFEAERSQLKNPNVFLMLI